MSAQIETDIKWMLHVFKLARYAESIDEVPVGAVIGKDNPLVAEWNQPITSTDPTAHAEIVALRSAADKLTRHPS